MNVPFLSLHDVTAMHGEEIREAARRVIDSGWYLQGNTKEAWNTPQLSLPITEMLADSELSIPISPCMTSEYVKYVVDTINSFVR